MAIVVELSEAIVREVWIAAGMVAEVFVVLDCGIADAAVVVRLFRANTCLCEFCCMLCMVAAHYGRVDSVQTLLSFVGLTISSGIPSSCDLQASFHTHNTHCSDA